MKNFFLTFLAIILSFHSKTFADGGGVLGIDEERIRKGDIHIDDIGNIIMNATNFFMGFAGGIAVIMIIIGSYQILFGSLSSDTTKGKNTIYLALTGFALSALSWFIVKFIIDNFA